MKPLEEERRFIAELVKSFAAFWDSDISGDFVLVHHGDPDGCCAAALSILWAQQTGRMLPSRTLWVGTAEFDFGWLLAELDRLQATKIVLLDVNIVNVPRAIDELLSPPHRRVAIYDDHVSTFSPERPNLLYLNPSSIGRHRREIPPCLFAYLLNADQFENGWIASIGLIGESLADQYSDFLSLYTPEQARDCQRAVRLLSSYYLAEEEKRLNTALSRVLQSAGHGGLQEFLNQQDATTKYLTEISRDVGQEVDRLAESEDTLIQEGRIGNYKSRVYEIQSRFRIANLVASQKRWKLKGNVVVVFQRLADRIMIEARTAPGMDDLDLAKILQAISGEVSVLNVGGHPRAAGAAIRYENRDAFLEKLRQIP